MSSEYQDPKNDLLRSSGDIVISNSSESVIRRLMRVTRTRSESQLSAFFDHSPSVMTNRRKRGQVPYHEAHLVALAWKIDLNWLLLGEGEGPRDPAIGDLPAPYPRSKPDDEGFASIPLYDIEVAAGDGVVFDEEHVKTWLHYRRDWLQSEGLQLNALVAVTIRGDSMYPTLKDGENTLINRAQTEPDGVYLIRVGEALRVKRLQRLTDGALRLSSDNEHYAPEVIAASELRNVEIIGHCHEHSGRVY